MVESYVEHREDPRTVFLNRYASNVASLRNNVMPHLANDFIFIEDQRPTSHEEEFIPARVFVEYFSKREVPLAAEGHALRDHDIEHIMAYQDMFVHTKFAQLVYDAACNSLSSDELCRTFTGAIDEIGNCMGFIAADYIMDRDPTLSDVQSLRFNLRKMVDLGIGLEETKAEEFTEELDRLLNPEYYRRLVVGKAVLAF
jgi:hypothetical protein